MPASNFSREAVAARLKRARSARYETAAAAAEALGMKPVTVRAHENGQNGLNQSAAERYASAYGVTADWLLYGQSGDGETGGSGVQDDRPAWRGAPLSAREQLADRRHADALLIARIETDLAAALDQLLFARMSPDDVQSLTAGLDRLARKAVLAHGLGLISDADRKDLITISLLDSLIEGRADTLDEGESLAMAQSIVGTSPANTRDLLRAWSTSTVARMLNPAREAEAKAWFEAAKGLLADERE